MKLFISGLGGFVSQSGCSNHGIATDGSIVTDQIQSLIDANTGGSIVLGCTPADVFIIDKPLIVPNNTTFTINGTLKLDDGNIRPLTEDLLDFSNIIKVANADQYFKAGQRIVVSDDAQVINGGGDWKTRKVGQSNIVQSVTSTEIVCVYNFEIYKSWSPNYTNHGYYVSNNAKVAQANSVFEVDGLDFVTVNGIGVLDGNLDNQWNIAAATYDRATEDLMSGCGIGLLNADDLTIDGLTIQNFVMHGIGSSGTNNRPVFRNLVIDRPVDKAIAALGLKNFIIENITNKNGVDEGEIAMYNGNDTGIIRNITSENNRRHCVAIISDQPGIVIENINLVNTRSQGLYIQNQLTTLSVSGVYATGNLYSGVPFLLYNCENVTADDINISELNNPLQRNLISVIAGSLNCVLTNVVLENNYVANNDSKAITFSDSDNITVDGFSIDGIYNAFDDYDTLNSNILVKNGIVSNYTNLIKTDRGNITFENVIT